MKRQMAFVNKTPPPGSLKELIAEFRKGPTAVRGSIQGRICILEADISKV